MFNLINLDLLFYFFIFVGGLCFGSFLNVLIDRLPQERALTGRSRSDCCQKTLGVLDLIPVLSFILSRGRCRHCGAEISFYYPTVELMTGLVTLIVFWSLPPWFQAMYHLLFFYSLIVFFFIDLKYGLVPVSIFLFDLILIILYLTLSYFGKDLTSYSLILNSLSAMAGSLFILFLIALTRGRGMGFGDVLLVFVFSLFLGFPKSLVMIFLSFIIGGLFSIFLLIFGFKKVGQAIPFGPFLVLANWLSFYYGNYLLDFYLRAVLKS